MFWGFSNFDNLKVDYDISWLVFKEVKGKNIYNNIKC